MCSVLLIKFFWASSTDYLLRTTHCTTKKICDSYQEFCFQDSLSKTITCQLCRFYGKKERKCINWVNKEKKILLCSLIFLLQISHFSTVWQSQSYSEIWRRSKAPSLLIFSNKHHVILEASTQAVLLESVFGSGTHSPARAEMAEWGQPETEENQNNSRLTHTFSPCHKADQTELACALPIDGDLTLQRHLGHRCLKGAFLSLLDSQSYFSNRPIDKFLQPEL